MVSLRDKKWSCSIISAYWYYIINGFDSQSYVCVCHDVSILAMQLSEHLGIIYSITLILITSATLVRKQCWDFLRLLQPACLDLGQTFTILIGSEEETSCTRFIYSDFLKCSSKETLCLYLCLVLEAPRNICTLRKKGSWMVLQNGQRFYLEPFAIWTRLRDLQSILSCEEP